MILAKGRQAPCSYREPLYIQQSGQSHCILLYRLHGLLGLLAFLQKTAL
jgi:hypothetical protein